MIIIQVHMETPQSTLPDFSVDGIKRLIEQPLKGFVSYTCRDYYDLRPEEQDSFEEEKRKAALQEIVQFAVAALTAQPGGAQPKQILDTIAESLYNILTEEDSKEDSFTVEDQSSAQNYPIDSKHTRMLAEIWEGIILALVRQLSVNLSALTVAKSSIDMGIQLSKMLEAMVGDAAEVRPSQEESQ